MGGGDWGKQGRERLHLVKRIKKFSLRTEVALELTLRGGIRFQQQWREDALQWRFAPKAESAMGIRKVLSSLI